MAYIPETDRHQLRQARTPPICPERLFYLFGQNERYHHESGPITPSDTKDSRQDKTDINRGRFQIA